MDPSMETKELVLVEGSTQPLGVQLVNARQTNRVGEPMDLVDLARSVQKADEFVRGTAINRLTVIADQIRYLQEQAKKVLEDAKRDAELHHAACNIMKKPGTMYYVYQRQTGQTYLSIISPQEWGASCPHEYVAAYRLELDMSWTPLEEVEKRTQEIGLMDKILNAQLALTDSTTAGLRDGIVTPNQQKVQEIKDSATAHKS